MKRLRGMKFSDNSILWNVHNSKRTQMSVGVSKYHISGNVCPIVAQQCRNASRLWWDIAKEEERNSNRCAYVANYPIILWSWPRLNRCYDVPQHRKRCKQKITGYFLPIRLQKIWKLSRAFNMYFHWRIDH